jgi:hypothetical protein
MSKGFPRDTRNVDARAWHGNIPMGHKYTMGVAGEEFFKRLRDKGEIAATLHEGAELPSLPPSLFDPETFAPLAKWVKVGPGGTVDTFTVYGEGEDRRVLALIRVDGAEGGLVHWVGDCDAADVSIGMRVKAVFEPKKKRKGALSDIRHFAPEKA